MDHNSGTDFNKHKLQKTHKQQVTWQIAIPLAIFCVLILSVFVLLIYPTNTEPSSERITIWASISAIFFLIPIIFSGFIFLIILAVLIVVLSKGIQKTPGLFMVIERYISIGRSWILRFSDKSAQPIIETKSLMAKFNKLFKSTRKET